MKISIAHDYLLQNGGAERVVATWAKELSDSPIYTLAYDQTKTFEVFDQRTVHRRISANRLTDRIEYLLPLLPIYSRGLKVEGEIALISTSGWAHQFSFDMPTVAYVHSPARWLYAKNDYSKQLGKMGRIGLSVSAPFLKRMDAPAMRRMDRIISNSKVSQQRLKEALGIESEIIHPPVEEVEAVPHAPRQVLPDSFALVVSRNRGYKNVGLAVEASNLAGLACVVVGAGTDSLNEPESGVFGLGRVSDSELKWLYGHAAVLVGSAHEDFGLTVLEANLEGAPVAAIPAGGYLETVSVGLNGTLASQESAQALAVAIAEAVRIPQNGCREWAQRFSPAIHMTQILKVLHDV